MKEYVKISMVATIYFVLTVVLIPYSFYGIQFRISEILMVLIIYDKKYFPALVVGCFLANLFSPLGIIDAFVGTSATILAGLCILISKKKYSCVLYPVLFNGILVSIELLIVYSLTPVIGMFFFNFLTVGLGELVVMVIGVIVFHFLEKNKGFMELICENTNISTSEEIKEE